MVRLTAAIMSMVKDSPVACVAIRKISDTTCEGKRLFIKPEYRGKGYARLMIKAMTDKSSVFLEYTF
jgi:GNAT superfamily N-acetyltransferase